MRPLVFAGLVLATTSTLMAHHGWRDVDRDNPVAGTGVIKKLEYTNPHVFFELDLSNKVWRIELASPGLIEKRGLTRDMLAPGTMVTLNGFPYKQTSGQMRAEQVTVNGKTVSMLPNPPGR